MHNKDENHESLWQLGPVVISSYFKGMLKPWAVQEPDLMVVKKQAEEDMDAMRSGL